MHDYQVVAFIAQELMRRDYDAAVEDARAGGATVQRLSIDAAVEEAIQIVTVSASMAEDAWGPHQPPEPPPPLQ